MGPRASRVVLQPAGALKVRRKGGGSRPPGSRLWEGRTPPHGPGPLSGGPCAHTSHNANHPVVRPRAERAKDGVQVSCPQRAVPERGRHRVTPEPRAPTFWADRALSSLVCKWGENALRPGVARRLPQPGPTDRAPRSSAPAPPGAHWKRGASDSAPDLPDPDFHFNKIPR